MIQVFCSRRQSDSMCKILLNDKMTSVNHTSEDYVDLFVNYEECNKTVTRGFDKFAARYFLKQKL